jgi:hypothetical protein
VEPDNPNLSCCGPVDCEDGLRRKVGFLYTQILDSIVVSIPACHAGDRGSIPRLGEETFLPKSALGLDLIQVELNYE